MRLALRRLSPARSSLLRSFSSSYTMADAYSSSPAPGSSSSSSSSSDPSAASTTSSSSPSSPSSPFATAAGAGVAAALDWEHFRTHGHELVDFIVDYYKSVEARPVKSPVAPGYLRPQLPDHAPESAEPFSAVLADIESKIMPGVTHWQHPGFFAYFPANSSPPGLLGEMLSGMFNVIGFSWIASPAASELETVVLDWLAKLIGLPEVFLSQGTGGGVIQGTASEATLVALLAAKARALAAPRARAEETDDSLVSKFVVYTSDQAHSSIKKACMVAGIHLDRFRSLPAHGPDFRFDPEALATAIRDDQAAGLVPLFCCATLGTTSSGAFDPIDRIGRLCREHGLWFHVDAAWAGSAFVCPEFQHLHAGIEFADSFDFNPHKWMLTNFDCSTMWVQDRRHLLRALSLTPEYLRSKEYDSGLVSDYRDWQVPLGRRFRSLKLWMVLRTLGAETLRSYIREHVALAGEFADRVRGDARFELSAPVALSLVCFRLKDASDDANSRLLDAINATGRVFLVNTKLDGKFVLRFAVGNPLTTRVHVEEAWSIIAEHATKVLAEEK